MDSRNAEFITQQFKGIGIALTYKLMTPAASAEKWSDTVRLTVCALISGLMVILHGVADIVVNSFNGVIARCRCSRLTDSVNRRVNPVEHCVQLTVCIRITLISSDFNLCQ